ncbi:MAG: sensor histidine kinase [Oscillospiraceae bacterium]|jgi:signal transduction histidine kinase
MIMRQMTQALKQKNAYRKQTFFGRELEFRLRMFNVLATGGIVISFLMAGISLVSENGLLTAALNAASGTLAIFILHYTNRSRRYQLCYSITIVCVFLILFPAMFFVGGGYRSGMPCFFVFAVIFTVFMLDGTRMFFLAGLELVVYISCCIVAYRFPQSVSHFQSEEALVRDVVTGFVVSSLVLGASIHALLRLHNDQQKKLDEQNLLLTQINRMKNEWISNTSHEMKTPLTVISVDVQRAMDLMSDWEDDAQRANAQDLLRKAQAEVMRLARMVNGTLNLASLRENMDKRPTDCAVLLANCLDIWCISLQKQGNVLRAEIPPDLPKIFCDADLMVQVMENLLQNANTHTHNGTIQIHAKHNETLVFITVKDDGDGIPEELLPHVFERGVSGSGSTGYGLYLCKVIVESHRGVISIESSPGKGTAVTFTIPSCEGQLGGETS